ncbi:universal stress protein [Rathayibacter toxicus]|uniref:Universal stress protein n=1 Tax=Rathayibacter toxicus TaxID=145458 RepID=A0A0C5BQR8_9MICO|nr:universal stress protein [Rathayibacter toxicus]AJM76987.1 hypothetical protein TI83_01410 [Rathayibacter toxicus]ALS57219.1 hypothetical protein APU90_05080 [Rathayibacter toxicus]KKM47251.1 hypothetical protein VT73_00745 [Rathayibacter toxicus]PPG24062.1 universal stress protein [Rathayibacter toxicus]PPG48099.1 universal stress protein [Rathayibacter toxicus]
MTAATPIPAGPVLVGVVDGQHPEVLHTAVSIASGLGTSLLLVSVEGDPYFVGEYVDPMTGGIPLGLLPRRGEDERLTVSEQLRQTLEEQLVGVDVAWSLRAAQGEPAPTLAAIAEETDARMIVVGTRDPGVLASIAEFLAGSVAAHLAHHQQRPVLVVPRPARCHL